jgi:hypothetical protein
VRSALINEGVEQLAGRFVLDGLVVAADHTEVIDGIDAFAVITAPRRYRCGHPTNNGIVCRTGNRHFNAAMHRIASTQARFQPPGA